MLDARNYVTDKFRTMVEPENRNQGKKVSRSSRHRCTLDDVASSFASSTEDSAWERMSLIEYVHAHREPFRAAEPVINSSAIRLKRVFLHARR